MSKQVIGVGSIPNDHTGDTIRTAFTKTNSNFTELYNGLVFPKRNGDANCYLTNALNQSSPATQALATNTLRAHPFIIVREVIVSEIVSEVTTAVGSSTYRLAIYTDDGNCYPNSLVANSDVSTYDGSALLSKTGVFAANITLSPGLYWLAANSNSNPTLRAVGATAHLNVLGAAAGLGGTVRFGWATTLAYGAMPGTFPAGAAVTNTIVATLIGLKTV